MDALPVQGRRASALRATADAAKPGAGRAGTKRACFPPCVPPQVAFLRSQLQYALQESDAEASELQRQLAAACADAAAAGDALGAAGAREREREQLVAELSSTVQQQQGRLQVRRGGMSRESLGAARPP